MTSTELFKEFKNNFHKSCFFNCWIEDSVCSMEKFKEYIELINKLEDDDLIKLIKKYARTNIDLIQHVRKPSLKVIEFIAKFQPNSYEYLTIQDEAVNEWLINQDSWHLFRIKNQRNYFSKSKKETINLG